LLSNNVYVTSISWTFIELLNNRESGTSRRYVLTTSGGANELIKLRIARQFWLELTPSPSTNIGQRCQCRLQGAITASTKPVFVRFRLALRPLVFGETLIRQGDCSTTAGECFAGAHGVWLRWSSDERRQSVWPSALCENGRLLRRHT